MSAGQDTTSQREQGRWDGLIGELHALRLAAGEPSYAEMTRRLVEQRIGDGQDEHAARIAKSSVHDAFRLGRSRINVALTREIVRLLGSDPAVVDGWMARPPTAAPEPAAPDQDETTAPDDTQVPAPGPPTATVRQMTVLAVACLAGNLLGREFVDFFAFPIYLDMVGTAVAALVLGPWRGAGVGLATNVVGVLGSGWISLPFALANVAGALVWGYGVRRWDMGRSLPRFFVLNLLAAVTCSAVAIPILLTQLREQLRSGHDSITVLVHETLGSFEVAVGFSNVLTSSADKLISGFVALVIVSALPLALRRRVPLVLADEPPPRSPTP